MCFVCTNCGKCKGGANLIRFVKCPVCGKPVEVDEGKCSSCGAIVEIPAPGNVPPVSAEASETAMSAIEDAESEAIASAAEAIQQKTCS